MLRTVFIFLLISVKKFQANGINTRRSFVLYCVIVSGPFIRIFVPGVYKLCFNGLSSIIKSNSISRKFNKVFPFAAAP